MKKKILFLIFPFFIFCNKNISTKNNFQKDSAIIRNEILVQLQSEIKIDSLLNNFIQCNLTVKKEISKRMNIYLLTFDDRKIKAEKVFKKIKNRPFVKSVEFNRKVQIREEPFK